MHWLQVIYCVGVVPFCWARGADLGKIRRYAPQSDLQKRNLGSLPLATDGSSFTGSSAIPVSSQQNHQTPQYQESNFQAPQTSGLQSGNLHVSLDGILGSFPPDIPANKAQNTAQLMIPSALDFNSQSQTQASADSAVLNVQFEPSLPPATFAPPKQAAQANAARSDSPSTQLNFVQLPPAPPAQRPRVEHHSVGRGGGYQALHFPTAPPVAPAQPYLHSEHQPAYFPNELPVEQNVAQLPNPGPQPITSDAAQQFGQQLPPQPNQLELPNFEHNQQQNQHFSPSNEHNNQPQNQHFSPSNGHNNQHNQQENQHFSPSNGQYLSLGQDQQQVLDSHHGNQPNLPLQGVSASAHASGDQALAQVTSFNPSQALPVHSGNQQQGSGHGVADFPANQGQLGSQIPLQTHAPMPAVLHELPVPVEEPGYGFEIGNGEPQRQQEQIFTEDLPTISEAVFGDGLLTPEGQPQQTKLQPYNLRDSSQTDEVGKISSFSYFNNPFDGRQLRMEAVRTIQDRFQEFMADKTGFPGMIEPEKAMFTGYANSKRKTPSTKYGAPKSAPLMY